MQKICYLHTRIKWTEIDVNIVKQPVFPYNLAQQYSLLNQRSNTGSENTYSSPTFSIKSRSVSMRLLRVMVYALPNSYFRTTGIELKRYSPLATTRNMAVCTAVRPSLSHLLRWPFGSQPSGHRAFIREMCSTMTTQIKRRNAFSFITHSPSPAHKL